MNKKVKEIIKRLNKNFPKARIALDYRNPLELLFATILSAQCTDERVNSVTKILFRKYISISDYANARVEDLELIVRPCGFYRNKAGNIIKSARIIIEKYDGKVPNTMVDILTLPGVARKTANIVLGNAYGVVEGIAVDTHVRRISFRLGFTCNQHPLKIEQDLLKIVPKSEWLKFSYLLQILGRNECKARKADHLNCVLRDICPSSEK